MARDPRFAEIEDRYVGPIIDLLYESKAPQAKEVTALLGDLLRELETEFTDGFTNNEEALKIVAKNSKYPEGHI